MFLVHSGKVALDVPAPGPSPITIKTAGAGGVVGWSWCVALRRYEPDARALKATRAVAIDAQNLRVACIEDPADGYQFMTRRLTVVAERPTGTRL